ncbi:GNAT family N-acetyltransferase [Shewanella waksmanii]|uniref:GNAT family N-acetyltransferase n=1 Tax=Shewanella waksmanii TaxID=213783 RepID=UPI003737098C
MDFMIEQAGVDDVQQLAELFNQYRQFYHQADDIKTANDFIAQRLAQQSGAIFIARDQHRVAVGFLQLYWGLSSISASQTLILNDLFVLPQARKQGVARQLMLRAIEYAKSQQVPNLSLETHRDNLKAQALYQQLGFTQQQSFLTYTLDIQP